MKSFQDFAKTLPKHHRLNQFSASGEVNQIVICESEYNSIVDFCFNEGLKKAAKMIRSQKWQSDFALSHDGADEMMAQKIESELNKLKG